MGYLSELNKQTKSTIYLPHNAANINILLNRVDLSRQTFGKYFRLTEFALEMKVTGYYCHHLFKNIVSKVKNKNDYNYLQFYVCLQVFKELGIVVTNESDCEILKITDMKNPLNSSQFYNRLTTLKNI